MISLIDFDDSFTFNIYSTLKEIFPQVNVDIINKSQALSYLQILADTDDDHVVILGPGPGHPKEYKEFYAVISKLLNNKRIYLMGICLGHQLIWNVLGLEVSKGSHPIHGQQVCYRKSKNNFCPPWLEFPLKVQRYNSLAVKVSSSDILKFNPTYNFFISDGELIMSFSELLVTYQFHPESVGTYCPAQYFFPLKNILL